MEVGALESVHMVPEVAFLACNDIKFLSPSSSIVKE